jgi:phage N-6-adenine-methyltransferase
MTTAVYFSSATDEWATPQNLFDALDRIFHFTLDVCATSANAKCSAFYTREQDGLSQPWRGTIWCNPPYGRAIPRWVERAFEAARAGATVVMLVPARTDTAWWHNYVRRADTVTLLRGRLKFGGTKNSAPFPSAIVTFNSPIRYINECNICRQVFAANRSNAQTCGVNCRVAKHRRNAA